MGHLRSLLGPSWPVRGPFEAGSPSRRPTRNTPEAPKSARERPRAPGNPGVRPLKKLQPGLLAVAAAAQQHSCEAQQQSCEPWGTPLRARGTVADLLCRASFHPICPASGFHVARWQTRILSHRSKGDERLEDGCDGSQNEMFQVCPKSRLRNFWRRRGAQSSREKGTRGGWVAGPSAGFEAGWGDEGQSSVAYWAHARWQPGRRCCRCYG